MVFANDLSLLIGRFNTTPIPSHLDRAFDQKGNVHPFLGLQTPPPPLRWAWWKFVCERLQPSKIFLINNIFFTTYCKEYQFFTHLSNCIIIANVKTLDIYCKERETLMDFPLLFMVGLSNSFLLVIEIFFFDFFILFCNNKIKNLYRQK